MPELRKWKYATHKANPISLKADELVGHKYEHKTRLDILSPTKFTQYQPRCSCKWSHSEWQPSNRLAHVKWDYHIHAVLMQGSLL